MNKTSNCDRMRQYQNRSSQNKESEAEDRNFDIIQSLGSKGEKMKKEISRGLCFSVKTSDQFTTMVYSEKD